MPDICCLFKKLLLQSSRHAILHAFQCAILIVLAILIQICIKYKSCDKICLFLYSTHVYKFY